MTSSPLLIVADCLRHWIIHDMNVEPTRVIMVQWWSHVEVSCSRGWIKQATSRIQSTSQTNSVSLQWRIPKPWVSKLKMVQFWSFGWFGESPIFRKPSNPYEIKATLGLLPRIAARSIKTLSNLSGFDPKISNAKLLAATPHVIANWHPALGKIH